MHQHGKAMNSSFAPVELPSSFTLQNALHNFHNQLLTECASVQSCAGCVESSDIQALRLVLCFSPEPTYRSKALVAAAAATAAGAAACCAKLLTASRIMIGHMRPANKDEQIRIWSTGKIISLRLECAHGLQAVSM